MLKIILSGCSGKMGRVITDIVANDPECEIVAGVDPYTASNTDYPVYTSFENLPTADVIIDFSNPAALDGMLEFANKFNMPTVICTTGYNDTQIEKINAAAKNIPIFFSFNM